MLHSLHWYRWRYAPPLQFSNSPLLSTELRLPLHAISVINVTLINMFTSDRSSTLDHLVLVHTVLETQHPGVNGGFFKQRNTDTIFTPKSVKAN